MRRAGDKTYVRATVQVPDYLNFEEAHSLVTRIEENIRKLLGSVDITIHTERCVTHTPTEQLVERLTLETAGVQGVHEIETSYSGGKLYITLHVYVDPKLSMEEAGKIAGRIEDGIHKRIRDVENVTVHIEPTSLKKRIGPHVDESEIDRVIQEATQSQRDLFQIKRIVTYVADRKRYINIDCVFVKQISVEDAHKIATDIEEMVRTRFAETVVTVHTESE